MTADEPRILTWEGERFPHRMDWRRFECGIVESATETRMIMAPGEDAVRAEAYDAGVLFGPETELRWRKRRHGSIHFVVTEDRATGDWPAEGKTSALRPVEASAEGLPGQVLLWGEPRGPSLAEWYESRIPHVIACYPPGLAGKRVAVQLTHYRLEVEAPIPLGGTEKREVVLSRCQRLTAAAPEQEA